LKSKDKDEYFIYKQEKDKETCWGVSKNGILNRLTPLFKTYEEALNYANQKETITASRTR